MYEEYSVDYSIHRVFQKRVQQNRDYSYDSLRPHQDLPFVLRYRNLVFFAFHPSLTASLPDFTEEEGAVYHEVCQSPEHSQCAPSYSRPLASGSSTLWHHELASNSKETG